MLFAHWMLLVVSFLPIVAASFAKVGAGRYDNSKPRVYMEQLPDNTLQKRMVWAQENSWEALMMFAPALLLASYLQANPWALNLLAGVFVLARILYLLCYAKNWAWARSAVWFIGILCTVGLYLAAALAA